MSGFGIRAFKKIKQDLKKETQKSFYQHVISGENIWSVLAYLKLRAKYGADKVTLISANAIDKQTLLNDLKCSINTLRDENTATILRDLNYDLEIEPKMEASLFYKDSKFHDFKGRAKPLTLLEDEDHFISEGFLIDYQKLFNQEQWNNLDEFLACQQNKIISKILLTKPTDLVEKVNFILSTGEFEEVHCENLYWCESPKDFYKLISNKSELDDSIAAFCNALSERASLNIHFDVDQEVHSKDQTLFIPQSQTHDWGHFILDFKNFDKQNKKQEFKSLMFVELDEVNEEDLAKKVRLLKKTLERIFPNFAKARVTEHIHFHKSFLMKSTDDFATQIEPDKDKNLRFIGLGAPSRLDQGNWNALLYEARAICSLSEL